MSIAAAPMPVPANPLLQGLNPAQAEAVEALDGPVLVLAGAGTGKTRVLTTRLANLLRQRRAWPSQILAVTFTNKAAREIRERVERQLGQPVEGWWLGTFHSLAARLLRRHAELVGLKPNFTIIDTDDQQRLLKALMEDRGLNLKEWPVRLVHGAIGRLKDRGLLPEKVTPGDAGSLGQIDLVGIYIAYQQRLAQLNACDFGDLLLHNLTIFQQHPGVLARVQEQFRYILVDEYQDTNSGQYLWLRLLAMQHRNICCVGDDDQSIYGWRGAEIGNILRFDTDFPGAKVVRLEENYRSTGHILAAASAVIAHNRGRLGKTLWTSGDPGEKVQVRGVWDHLEEARAVSESMTALRREGFALRDMAVLVRAGFQTREFEERLLTAGIPYRVVGGLRFYERQEIRDALAYLRVIHQPDDDLAFERIVNVPKRGIGPAALGQVAVLARASGISLFQAARRLAASDELKPKLRQTFAALVADFDAWNRDLQGGEPHPMVARRMLEESGYRPMWKADKSPEAAGRVENLDELLSAMAEFESLESFLEHVGLTMELAAQDDADMVQLMTLHGAKGLEFRAVFLPGWEEKLFPSGRALEESGVSGLEEERRLAYVGITRARERLFISHASNRLVHGTWTTSLPSRFLGELPAADIEASAEPGMYDTPARTMEGFAGRMGPSDEWQGFVDRRFAGRAAGLNRNGPKTIESTAHERRSPARQGSAFKVGDRVFHTKFGYGTVAAADYDTLSVSFDSAGEKKVMDSFVVPAAEAG